MQTQNEQHRDLPAETAAEEMERLSRMMERESRRYPADFNRRGDVN